MYTSSKVQLCWPVLYMYSIPELTDFKNHKKKKVKLIPPATAESAVRAEAGQTAEGQSLCRTDNTAAM